MWSLTVQEIPRTEESTCRVAVFDFLRSQDVVERNLRDPFSPEQEAECRWYLEEYSTRHPFEEGKAHRVAQSIEDYAKGLFARLDLHRMLLSLHSSNPAEEPVALTLEIIALPNTDLVLSNNQSFHRLHWELLETPSLWPSFISEVAVTRIVAGVNVDPDSRQVLPLSVPLVSSPPTRGTYNVLLVISRDLKSDMQDALPDSVLNALLRVQAELKTRAYPFLLNVEVVRPGTFAALEEHLKTSTHRHGPGYFDLVHFDMHGIVRQGRERSGGKA